MTLHLVNPEQLPPAQSYTQVIVASGSKLIFIAGQVAEDSHGKLVGLGALDLQARQAFANVGRALAAVGALPEQVPRITIYVVDFRPEYLPHISAARAAIFGDHKPTDTIIGVQALANPSHMIEIDAIAVVG